MNQQTCNLAWLDAFLRSDLNENEEQLLTSHLDKCSNCREELENRAAEQSVWREASSLLCGAKVADRSAISSLDLGDIHGPQLDTRSPQIDLVLQQLAPTDDPESLGRIGGYEVTGVVGAGGMGVVLKAHDRSLDRIVAIKVMSPHLASSGSARKRFAREAKAAAAVLHPNVIAIHSVASEEVSPYLVMPYVRGASLQKRIDSQGPLPLKDTLRIGAQIAAGLAAAHEQGLVHRDIKPANILLEEGVERVTITDFGLARTVDDASMTCSGVIAGTPQYMSPEQTRGEPIDARSDLFSLGSVLYALCAGRPPFRAETTYGVLHRIANDNPTPVCEVNSDVPDWLGHIIARLMTKRPEDRFESAAQVAELLEGCLAHVQQPAGIPLPANVEQLSQLLPSVTTAAAPPKKQLRQLFYNLPPIGKLIAAAASAIALFFAGILIVLELGKGTLTIESEIDDVPIRIMRGDEVVKSLTVSKEGATTRIGAGKYIVEIGQEFDKAVIKEGGVELSRGATAIVKVTQTNADKPEDEKAKDEAAKAWLSRPVVGTTLDGKSFQLTGHDALMDCVMRNNSETLNRLLTVDKYDLDFSARDGQWTLLQIALLHECIETTSLLLRHGANPSFASKGTPLPLELAQRSVRKELVALVQKYLESNVPHSQTNVGVRLVYTKIDGEVHEILVRHNSVVTKGQVLLRLRNDELQMELTKTSDQMKESNTELDRITEKMKDHKDLPSGEVEEMEIVRNKLQNLVVALKQDLTRLNDRCAIKSPVDGTIVTRDVEQLLQNRPVVAGQVLMKIAVGPSRNSNEAVTDKNSAKSSSHQDEAPVDTSDVEWPPSGFELTEGQTQRVIGAQTARIVRALDTSVDLKVDGKSSLAEIVSSVVREHRISIRLNEKSFEEQGVAIQHVPAFEVRGVTLMSALTTLLEKLLQHRSIPPVIEVRHGVLTLAAKAPSDIITDLARSKPTSVVFQSMGPDKQVLPETVVEVQGYDGVYFVLSDQNGLAPVVGHGVSNWYTTARDSSGQLMAYTNHGLFLSKPTKPYVLNFDAPKSLAVSISDEHGRPIEGATVGILTKRCRYQFTDASGRAEFMLPVNNQYVQAIFALKSGKGLDYISYQPQWATDLPRELNLQLVGAREMKVRLRDEQNQLLKGVPIFPVKFDFVNSQEPKAEKSLSWWKLAMGAVDWSTTNEQGEVVFDWLPRDHAISFLTTNRELEHNTLDVTNLKEDVVEFLMKGRVEVSGRVLDIDGKPVAGASVIANSESRASANTDEEGRFVLKVRPGSTFYLEAVDATGGGWMAKRRGISDWIDVVAGQPSINIDVVIRPAARVFGRVTYTFDSAPAANIQLSYQFDGPPGRDPIEFKKGSFMSRGYGINGYTDDEGRFEFYAVPGKYTVSAVPDGGRRAAQEFTVVAAEPHEANMAISKDIPVKGRVVAGDPPMPLGRVTIKRKHLTDPFNHSGYDWSTNESGELVQDYRDRDPMILWGHSEDKQLWGVTDMAWDDPQFEMKLAPRVAMKVRILTSKRKPIVNTEFTYGMFRRIQPQYQKEEDRRNINVHSIEPREGTTDENGILELKDLIVGGDYIIHMASSHFRFEKTPDSPIAQAKILVDSMAKDVVVDIVLMQIGFDKLETTTPH